MISKFDFYEIVKIIAGNEPRYKEINGKLAVIRGKAQDEQTHEWFYVLSVYETDGILRQLPEKYLQHTGRKADPKVFLTGLTIRVKVNPETGEGYIVDEE